MTVLIIYTQSRLRVLGASKRQAFPSPVLQPFWPTPFSSSGFLSVYPCPLVRLFVCLSVAKIQQELSYRKQIVRQLRTQYVDNTVTLNFYFKGHSRSLETESLGRSYATNY